jgi:tRNA (cytidine/uridine-2'-O-)-methyltransferase
MFQLDIVLYQPEIPQNTGNIARTCAALGAGLHLIKPLGFSLDDRYLKRAGLDYWPLVKVETYSSLDDFFARQKASRLFFFSKKAIKR